MLGTFLANHLFSVSAVVLIGVGEVSLDRSQQFSVHDSTRYPVHVQRHTLVPERLFVELQRVNRNDRFKHACP